MEFKVGDKVKVLETPFTKNNKLVDLEGVIIKLPSLEQSSYYEVLLNSGSIYKLELTAKVQDFKMLKISYKYEI